MSHLSAMHEFAETRIVLLGRSSMATLVPPGVTDIVPDLDAEGPSCGLVPMQGPASVKTAGLRWNLEEGRRLRFGEFISTSNQVRAEDGGVVRVETDRALVWTTDVTRVRGWGAGGGGDGRTDGCGGVTRERRATSDSRVVLRSVFATWTNG